LASGRSCGQHRGKEYRLWQAVDQHRAVLGILVQSPQYAKAAKRLLRKLLKKLA
jgi:transposase-like protein